MNETGQPPSDDICEGDRVVHRKSGKRGKVLERLARGAGFAGGEPQTHPAAAWVKWEGEAQREAVLISDLAKVGPQ